MSAPETPWSAPPPDAELIRLGVEFDRLYAEWFPVNEAMCQLSRNSHEALKAVPDNAAYFAVHDKTGLTAAMEADGKALASLDAVANEIRALPATGFAGLAVKVRVVRFDVFCLNDFDVSEEDMDWEVECFQRFATEIERLAS